MKVLRSLLFAVGTIVVVVAVGIYLRPLDFYDDFTYLESILHGVHSEWVPVSGLRMHYEVEGPDNGKPIVLVHGLGGRAENWRALAPYFAHAGYRVYMPDLIGYGRSAKPADFSYSIHDEAAIVVAFLNTLGLKQVDLGGWSMGGWIAQVAASEHPERFKRLIIFDSAGLDIVPDWDTRLFTPVNVTQLVALDALLMPHPPAIPGFIAHDILRTSRDTNWVVSRALAQMFTARDVTDSLLPQLNMPVLIEWGALDRITPLTQGQKIHKLIPHSLLQTYSSCGHLAPLQCADQMGPNVVRFLQNTRPGSTQAPPALASHSTAPAPPESAPKAPLEAARVVAGGSATRN